MPLKKARITDMLESMGVPNDPKELISALSVRLFLAQEGMNKLEAQEVIKIYGEGEQVLPSEQIVKAQANKMAYQELMNTLLQYQTLQVTLDEMQKVHERTFTPHGIQALCQVLCLYIRQ